MRVAAIIMALLMLTACMGSAPSTVDGFRGLRWGDQLSTLQGFTRVGHDNSYDGIDIYKRANEEPTLGAAKLDEVLYYFWHDQLCSVWLHTRGYLNFEGIKQTSFTKFGYPLVPNRYMQRYLWSNDTTFILLDYSEVTEKGYLHLSSKKLSEEQEKYAAKKAEEGAAKGF